MALNPLLIHNVLLFLVKRQSFLQQQTAKPNKMTPNCKKLYKASLKIKNQLSKNKSKINSFKHRIKLADKFLKEENFSQMVEKVNSTTYNFILSQVKNQKKKFTVGDLLMMTKYWHCLYTNKAQKVTNICHHYLHCLLSKQLCVYYVKYLLGRE